MRREWSTLRADHGGSGEGAEEIALALAQILDADTLRSVLDAFVSLDRIGGEFYVGAYRIKFDAEGNRVDPASDTPGEYETIGYLWQYEHVAKRTRAATGAPKEPDADFSDLHPAETNGEVLDEIPEPVET